MPFLLASHRASQRREEFCLRPGRSRAMAWHRARRYNASNGFAVADRDARHHQRRLIRCHASPPTPSVMPVVPPLPRPPGPPRGDSHFPRSRHRLAKSTARTSLQSQHPWAPMDASRYRHTVMPASEEKDVLLRPGGCRTVAQQPTRRYNASKGLAVADRGARHHQWRLLRCHTSPTIAPRDPHGCFRNLKPLRIESGTSASRARGIALPNQLPAPAA